MQMLTRYFPTVSRLSAVAASLKKAANAAPIAANAPKTAVRKTNDRVMRRAMDRYTNRRNGSLGIESAESVNHSAYCF